MEPLLELSDRITATLWEFVRDRPLGFDRWAEPVASQAVQVSMRRRAETDYARLQELLDLWNPRGPTGNPNDNPLDWVFNEEYSFWARVRTFVPIKRKGQSNAIEGHTEESQQQRAANTVVGELGSRIVLLEEIWRATGASFLLKTDFLKRMTDALSGQPSSTVGGLEPELSVSLLAYSTVPVSAASFVNSDELFDRIARWLSSSVVSIDQRIHLASSFLQLPPGKQGNRDYPFFLMEENIEGRVKELLFPRFRSFRHIGKVSGRNPEDLCSMPPSQERAEVWRKMSRYKKLEILLNRKELREFCKRIDVAVPFSLVFSDELDEIVESRPTRWGDSHPPELPAGPSGEAKHPLSSNLEEYLPQHHPAANSLFGVALSGGGIRSATFALGVFQAMADRNILPYIDFLSSVSGGGYFSSFLVAWIKRRGGVRSVQHSLRGFASDASCTPPQCPKHELFELKESADSLPANQDPKADHLRPIRLLRDYGRYLAPEDGLFSADTWTVFSTWLRNTSLNFVILMLFLWGLLLLPRTAIFLTYVTRGLLSPAQHSNAMRVAFLAGLPLVLVCLFIGRRNLRTFDEYRINAQQTFRGWGDKKVVSRLIVPTLLAGFVETLIIWNTRAFSFPLPTSMGFAFACLVGLMVMAISSFRSVELFTGAAGQEFLLWIGRHIFPFVLSCAAAALLMAGFCAILGYYAVNSLSGTWIVVALGPPLMTAVLSIAIVLMLGLSGRTLSEEQREWWSRLGAWQIILTLLWLGICGICFFVPLWILQAGIRVSAAAIPWAAITAAAVKLAYSPTFKSSQSGQSQPWWQNLTLSIGPPVFVVGLLCALAFVIFITTSLLLIRFSPALPWWLQSLYSAQTNLICCTENWLSLAHLRDNYWPLLNTGSILMVLLPGVLFVLSVWMAKRVDVNLFSMHHFYRNRLVRAYLGASRTRAHREPNAFTGFDMQDDLYLHRLVVRDLSQEADLVTDCRASYFGPFPILNTALNVTKGQDLGLQQRRAESFIFTPIWSGFDYMRRQSLVRESANIEFGFRCTRRFGGDGAFIGTAMAISGAAFSSNAGYHTSPPLAFLLTVFGVRLGWWAGNPRTRFWSVQTPPDSLSYLKDELTANTTTDKDYVLLTDGGHFENMGLYELIRRRCRYIIVVDAEQDEKFKLEGIGGAVRKCRNDFGVVIDLQLDPLRPLGNPKRSQMHHTIGTVRYPGVDQCGMIIYIKASLTGDESVDLVEFSQSHPEFPHTPTVNQMFDESHFESYRQLGHHIGSNVFRRNWPDLAEGSFTDRFCEIEEDWKLQKNEMERKAQKNCGSSKQAAGQSSNEGHHQ